MKGLIRRLLFPPRCAACRELSDWYPESVALCENCQADWENQKGERCLICGARVCDCDCMTEEMKKAKCEALGKLVYYHPNTRKPTQNRLLYAIKEHKTRHNFAFLAREMLPLVERFVKETDPASVVITYLPRTREAKRKYEVDQAEELARAISKHSGISVTCLLERLGGKPQKELSREARIRNARQSYQLKGAPDLKGKTILLVDDVVTTGAGMAVGARLLRRAGAKRVFCVAVATDICNREIL